jgi:gliding motility associated protien GldN
MKWNHFLMGVMAVFFVTSSFGQANILNAKSPDQIGIASAGELNAINKKKPLAYGYVEDRDILWSKRIWEVIDLDERVNFPLYYPIDTINIGSNRRSLYDVLMAGIRSGRIKNIYTDAYFTEKRTLSDISAAISKIDTTDLGREQYNAGEEIDAQYIDRRDLSSADIMEYRISGMWYFDKRQAELKYRLLGIAPVAPDVNFLDEEEPDLVELFWVWFPDAREVLFEASAFVGGNSSMDISFDHLLNARRFNAVIYKEENVQGDRGVNDYITESSFMQLLESERIKEQIRNFEQDMWNY